MGGARAARIRASTPAFRFTKPCNFLVNPVKNRGEMKNLRAVTGGPRTPPVAARAEIRSNSGGNVKNLG
jgi:hypothetical protein